MGISRPYLAVHFPIEVLLGWVFGILHSDWGGFDSGGPVGKRAARCILRQCK